MKNFLTILIAVILIVSCTQNTNEAAPQQEIQTVKGGGKPGSGGGGTVNSIPAPTGLTATALGGGQVALTWNAVTGATSYWIYRDNIVLAIITTTSFTDVYAGATTHTYAVAAVVNSTLGTRSNPVSVTSR